MYERVLTSVLAAGKSSVLLLGPRQVGKSTILASLSPDRTINLAVPSVSHAYLSEPARFERELAAAPPSVRTYFLDEVQRAPALLDVVQAVVDEKPRRFRFLLSGSSARKLRRGHANLLPGRIHLRYLHPLLAAELGSDFRLSRALAHGTLPGIWSEKDAAEREATLRGYVDLYLREEVQAEALVRDLGGYVRLLEWVAASSGRILNLNALSGDAGVPYETARRYLEVLEDTLVLFRVPAFSGSDRASLVQHPRIYLFDVGVRNALLRRPLDRCLPDEKGILFEHFIAGELHARVGSAWPSGRLFHFRTRSGVEVDFILDTGDEIWAIEVKSSRNVRAGDASALRAFQSRFPKVRRKILLFDGPRRQALGDGVEAIPVEEFLEELPGF